jgi:soluble lytic murein transglycosylase-like protein
MKAIKSYTLALFIGFILGITTTLVWQQYFEIIPRYSVNSNDIRGLAWQAARRYHVDATLLFAIIDQESQWNSNAISPKGAIGLMQILPITGKSECDLTEEQLFNPQLNLDCGARYFTQLFKHFGSVRLALCAYNAGPERVAQLGRCPQFQETIRYTQNILTAWQGGK